MKKFLWVILLALLAFLMFRAISQAAECIYLYTGKTHGANYYYDSSRVSYSGDIVAVDLYEGSCSAPMDYWHIEIDCARRMVRYEELWGWESWESIVPVSADDILSKKLCR